MATASVSPPCMSVIPPSQALSTRQAQKFQQLKNDGELIDFTIVSNGQEFPCHSVILAASSSFLEAMMKTEMKEARTRQANLDVIPPAIIMLLIDHMYQQQVTMPHDLLRETFIASDYLDLKEMKEICISLAGPVINSANALLWWQTAEKFENRELKTKCTEIIHTSLPEVSKSPEFLQLGFKEVSPYLDGTKKNIDPDDQLEATIDWVSHRPEERTNNMAALIEKINLLKCSIECLETATETRAELFQRCPTALSMIVRCSLQLARQGGARKKRNKKGSKASIVVLIGGQTGEYDGFNKTCWELTETMTIQQLCEIPDGHAVRFGVCKTPLGFVVSGGEGSVKCSLFITSTKSWKPLRSFQQARFAHGSIFMKERIFLLGGNISGGTSSSVISLVIDDVDEGEWQEEPALPFAVWLPEVACEVDGRSRPFLLDTNTNKLISLAMENNAWISKASMPGERCFEARMISVNDKLLVAGGTKPCLAWYSPDTDTWLTGTAPRLNHFFGALVSHGQTVFLLGGKLDSVEEYTIDEESWCTCKLQLPKPYYNLHALALDI